MIREEDNAFAALARKTLPSLIAEHRKFRAHIIETIGEDGMADLLKGN